MDHITTAVNRLLVYVNQLDPLVPNNEPTLEVWTHALRSVDLAAAKRAVMDYYGNVDPADRQPITPGYIRRQARRIEATYNRDAVMCQQHDWNYAATCRECTDEIAEGTRHPDQIGHNIKRAIPAPAAIRSQVQQLAAAKDLDS